MWSPQHIQALKKEAYPYHDDDYIREHLTALNVYFNRYVNEKHVLRKDKLWQALEMEAELITVKLAFLDVEV